MGLCRKRGVTTYRGLLFESSSVLLFEPHNVPLFGFLGVPPFLQRLAFNHKPSSGTDRRRVSVYRLIGFGSTKRGNEGNVLPALGSSHSEGSLVVPPPTACITVWAGRSFPPAFGGGGSVGTN